MQLHGGTITAASDGPGHGATFTVSLPIRAVSAEPASEPSRGTSGEAASLAGVRVLVVDDEADARELVQEVLEGVGAAVRAVDSVRAALYEISAWRPDVVVSDIGMPGDDGYAFVRRLRALAPDEGAAIPAIALTAYVLADDALRAREAGFQVHLPKPVNRQRLISMIRKLAPRSDPIAT